MQRVRATTTPTNLSFASLTLSLSLSASPMAPLCWRTTPPLLPCSLQPFILPSGSSAKSPVLNYLVPPPLHSIIRNSKDQNATGSATRKPGVYAHLGSQGVRDLASAVETDKADGTLSSRWREIQGADNWKGLLDPLDLELRKNIIRYGEFNQAVYDAFDNDAHSKYAGSCKYNKMEFFDKVGLTRGGDWGYRVCRYLYATSTDDIPGDVLLKSFSREAWSRESNWIGYVAVATDSGKSWLGRRDIVIVWRGTNRTFEWADDFNLRMTNVTPLLPAASRDEAHPRSEPKVEKGFLVIYTARDPKSPFTPYSARDQIVNEVKSLVKEYRNEDISITVVGHSLGAALAILNAYDIAQNGLNQKGDASPAFPVTAICFGCPQVGNDAFEKRCTELPGLRVLRVKNELDILTKFPGELLGYRHVGTALLVDSRKSPYLKDSKFPGDWHNLEAHIHLVAGTHGPSQPFKLVVNRDIALVNKSSEFLRDEYLIPGSWWQEKNKGMVQTQDGGSWYMPDRPDQNVPKPEALKNT